MTHWTFPLFKDSLSDIHFGTSKVGLILQGEGAAENLVADTDIRAMSTGAEDMMYRLLIEMQHYHDADDYLDWADEFDWPPGELQTRLTFDRVAANHTAMRRLIGDDRLSALIFGLHIGQAIHMARPGPD